MNNNNGIVEGIFHKHCHILFMDKVLGPVLHRAHTVLYTEEHRILVKVVKKILDPQQDPFFPP